MSDLISIVASLFMVGVVITYLGQVIKNSSTPNPATWVIWSIVSTMNAISYFSVVQDDILKASTSAISAVGLSIVFIYSLAKGKMGKIGLVEILSFLMAIIIGFLWKKTGNASMANLSLQLIFIVSFIPTIRGLLKRELKEKPLPWILAVISQGLLGLAIIFDWQSAGGWIALAYPIINGVIGNGIVAIIVIWQDHKRHLAL